MPLTKENRDLLPPTFWSSYNQRIARICADNGVEWIDADFDWSNFSHKDYVDTVHLNLPGSLNLTRPLAIGVAHACGLAKVTGKESRNGEGMF